MSIYQNESHNINQESNYISLQKDLEATKQKIANIKRKLSELQAKNIKNKPLDENLIHTNDSLPYTSFDELKKNSQILSQRQNNENLKSLIKQYGENGNPIFITDLSKLLSQHLKWIENLPMVKPCYAVKCNNDYMIVKTLKNFCCGFDCASMEEIRQVLEIGANPESIIFANPIKPISHLNYAFEKGIDHMTFDNADELVKIKKYHPNAKLVIRIRVDDSSSVCQFGAKFGVHTGLTRELIEKVQELEMNLVGVSFHVGSGCTDPNAYYEAIKKAREVFDEAEEYNMKLTLLDIGGGFTSKDFEHHSKIIRESIKHFFSDLKIKIIAEPGRYYANPTMNLAVNVTGRRQICDKKNIEEDSNPKEEIDKNKSFMYYVSDGVYGTFNCIFYDHWELQNLTYLIQDESNEDYILKSKDDFKTNKKFLSTIWGPTCDSLDCLTKNYPMPELNIGDWIIFEEFGAYTISAGCEFNGFPRPTIYYSDTRISKKLEMEMAEIYNYDI